LKIIGYPKFQYETSSNCHKPRCEIFHSEKKRNFEILFSDKKTLEVLPCNLEVMKIYSEVKGCFDWFKFRNDGVTHGRYINS